MRIAIMQPYLFPYLGYFQLVHAVDAFVFLDDVAFIKKGWINRNKLNLNGQDRWFSVPLEDQSQNRSIQDTRICPKEFPRWRDKFRLSLRHFYGKAPFYGQGMALAEEVLSQAAPSVGAMATTSVQACCRVLELKRTFSVASETYPNDGLKKEIRLADICKRAGADEYVNPSGGIGLYSKEQFFSLGVRLHFLKPGNIVYQAGDTEHGLGLSVLDAIMWCGPERVATDFVHRYTLC